MNEDRYDWAADERDANELAAKRERGEPVCGYCSGRGVVFCHPLHVMTCEYCGGAGTCEEGDKLIPARVVRRV